MKCTGIRLQNVDVAQQLYKTFLCRSLAGDEKPGYFTFPAVDIQTELPKPKPVKNYILPPIENGVESSLGAQDQICAKHQ